MATKLKNLEVTSVDLVDRGANPDAHVRLFKRGEEPPEEEPTDTEKGLLRKFARWLAKGYGDARKGGGEAPDGPDAPDGVAKGARLLAEELGREGPREAAGEVEWLCHALSESLSSIICDGDMTPGGREAMMAQSLREFGEAIAGPMGAWARGRKSGAVPGGAEKGAAMGGAADAEAADATDATGDADAADAAGAAGAGKQQEEPTPGMAGQVGGATKGMGSMPEKEGYDTMKIDKGSMSPEDLEILEGLEKKYAAGGDGDGDGAAQDAAGKAGDASGDGEGAASGEVAKALADMRAAYEAQTAELEALKKSLEIGKLAQMAEKYEPLGKRSGELAEKLYELRKAGGTAYDDYVALLDESLAMVGKGSLFGEIGSSRQGTAGGEEAIGMKAAEIEKAGGASGADAVVKAFEENPELAARYEEEYMGR